MSNSGESTVANKNDGTIQKELITKKDINKTFFRWWLTCEMSNNYERMQAIGWCASISPILKKLYPKKEDLSAALTRNLTFFNTEGIFGGLILGSSLALEEQSAKSETMQGEMITAYKTGLMGPVAGLGDTVDWATVYTMILAACSAIASNGNPLAAAITALMGGVMFLEGLFFTRYSFKTGRESIKKILHSGVINEALMFANIFGIMMVGSMTAALMKLDLTIKSGTVDVQKVIDTAFPGIVTLCVFGAIFWAMKKKNISAPKMVFIVMGVCVVASFFGIV